jgi:hypothetical protein
MHSAWYRRPGEFARHETVVVVGSGPSAMDLCTDSMCIMPLLLHTILASPSQIGVIYPDGNETYRKVGRVVKYRGGGSVLLEDGSIEFNIDLVTVYSKLLATGYEMSSPFFSQIKSGIPPLPPPLPNELHNSTYRVFPFALHLLSLQGNFPPTSIAFPGLLYRVAPFPLFEDQARAIAGVLEESLRRPGISRSSVMHVMSCGHRGARIYTHAWKRNRRSIVHCQGLVSFRVARTIRISSTTKCVFRKELDSPGVGGRVLEEQGCTTERVGGN